MLHHPVFRPSFRAEIVEPEGVYLLSERNQFVLKGQLHCRIAPLLDGRHTVDDIVDALAEAATAAEVYYALGVMEQKGYVVDADGAAPPVREDAVALARFGAVPLEPLSAALASLSVAIRDDAPFTVVVTDDYLREGLAEFNATALASGRPWLLVKPVGASLWIGPVFRPPETACWECLAQRLRVNRPVESYVQQQKRLTAPVIVPQAALPTTMQIACALAAAETARALAGGGEPASSCTLVTFDTIALETQKHVLLRRPQCPSCGDPGGSDREPVPVTLRSQRKYFTADGGHRAAAPEKTLATYAHHISPITGVVMGLTRVPTDDDHVLKVYVAGDNLAMKHDNLYFLRQGLRSKSGGKGITDAQARASGLCEALERYSGTFHGDERRRVASCRELGARALHPNACMLFSEAQYLGRHEWNARGSRFNRVPDPFDESAPIEWTPVWSLSRREFRYLPTGYCYYGYPQPPSALYFRADSNGNAAGNTLEEAILQGFLELVERDAVALWWYNRVPRPGVDLTSFDERYIAELKHQYAKMHRDVWVLDLTSDVPIPVFAALSRRTDGPVEEIVFGFGAHLDPRIAVLRALTEMNQSLPAVLGTWSGVGRSREEAFDDPDAWRWWQTATVSEHGYLVADDSPPRRRADYGREWSDDVREDVLRCQAIAERHGLEMLVLDQTRPDIGLHVAKVIVPGLRHFWARFAPGRLYDVPVQLGWLPKPLTEDQLNPIPMFL